MNRFIQRRKDADSRHPDKLQGPPKRFRIASRLALKVLESLSPVKETAVDGIDNVKELPKDQQFIFAVSHDGSQDFPIVMKLLSEYRDIIVTDMSTHHNPSQEFGTWIITKMSGMPTLPISWGFEAAGQKRPVFVPSDVDPMKAALRDGNDIMIAAYNPVTVGDDGRPIKPKPGFMASNLAMETGCSVVPIAVDTVKDGSKYRAIVHIGKPFSIDKDADDVSGRRTEIQAIREGGEIIFEKVRSLRQYPEQYPFAEDHRKKS